MSASNTPADPAGLGQVAVVGRPNVGKSTLVNRLLGEQVSIVTHKAQTTRRCVGGRLQLPDAELRIVDTPGLHRKEASALNRYMNRAARGSVADSDAVVWMMDARGLTEEDEFTLSLLDGIASPVIAALNKVDRVAGRGQLLPLLETLASKFDFKALVPLSARSGEGTGNLIKELLACMPAGDPARGVQAHAGISGEFIAAEAVREQILLNTHQEIPYQTTVTIEAFERSMTEDLRVEAILWVARPGQKAVVIGKGGSMLKTIGTRARRNLERRLACRVHLELQVRVKANWSHDEHCLRQLGYGA